MPSNAAPGRSGCGLLFEGAQGTLLDIDHGTYPYVTSSNSTAGGACTGTGVPPTRIDGAIGVLKAYTTRVGGGPFPSELGDARGDFLRQRGNEFGTVTGRPRRCGWLDTVVARYAQLLNGIDTVALTKLDVLDDFDEIPVCVAYRLDGRELRELPPDRRCLERAEPVLRVF
ncbi:MAG: adenylosuccinate synthetase, partial [Actinobacteria bacterium]